MWRLSGTGPRYSDTLAEEFGLESEQHAAKKSTLYSEQKHGATAEEENTLNCLALLARKSSQRVATWRVTASLLTIGPDSKASPDE